MNLTLFISRTFLESLGIGKTEKNGMKIENLLLSAYIVNQFHNHLLSMRQYALQEAGRSDFHSKLHYVSSFPI